MSTHYGPRTFIADAGERKRLTLAPPHGLHVERIRIDVSQGKIGIHEVWLRDHLLVGPGLGDARVRGDDAEWWISPRALADVRFDLDLRTAELGLVVEVEALVNDSECCLVVDGTRLDRGPR
jgi:hypothetical protein